MAGTTPGSNEWYQGPFTISVAFVDAFGDPAVVEGLEVDDFIVSPSSAHANLAISSTTSASDFLVTVTPALETYEEPSESLVVSLKAGAVTFTDVNGNSWVNDPASTPAVETYRLAPAVVSTAFRPSSTVSGTAQGYADRGADHYNVGETVEVEMTFTQPVTVSPAEVVPTLELRVGGSSRIATLDEEATAGDPSSGVNPLVFTYTVQAGDEGPLEVVQDSLSYEAGSIRGTLGLKKALSSELDRDAFPSATDATGPVGVDAKRPTIAAITPPSQDTYAIGETVAFTVQFSEPVLVSGTELEVILQEGTGPLTSRAASYASGSSTSTVSSSTVIYEYVVQEDDLDEDGLSLGTALVLAGGSVTDLAGNNLVADLPLMNVGPFEGVLVDGVKPVSVDFLQSGDAADRPASPRLGDEIVWSLAFSEVVANVDVGDLDLTVSPIDATITPGTLDIFVASVIPATTLTDAFEVRVSGTDLLTFDGAITIGFDDESVDDPREDITDEWGNPLNLTDANLSSASRPTWIIDTTAPVLDMLDLNGESVEADAMAVLENQSGVGTVRVEDANAVSFALEGPDADAMRVDDAGVITFADDAIPDYELPNDSGRDGVYEVTLLGTDAANHETRIDLRVQILDVPEGDVTVSLVRTGLEGVEPDVSEELVAPFEIDVLFREPVAGFGDLGDVVVRGGVLKNVESISDRDPPHQYRITVDAFTTGDVTIRIPEGVVLSPGGFVNAASEPLTVRVLADLDGDGIPDVRDDDRDGDGTPNGEDAFPDDSEEDSDRDGDGTGDNADAFPDDPSETKDTDGDGIGNNADDDLDGDGITNDADPDMDGDGVPNAEDAFPRDPEATRDQDGDGIPDRDDADADGDGIPDVNDPDRDNDGVPNDEDAFPDDPSEDSDADGDGVGDLSDAFPNDPTEQRDTDGDGVGDNSDPDIDGDGVPNDEDAFPRDAGGSKDSDGDGIPDDRDAFPDDPDHFGDLDGDGIPDGDDSDRDGDGVRNERDPFPNDATGRADSDGDGVPDSRDAFPTDPTASRDDDGDGIPNERDGDMDGDGIPNEVDRDRDGDGIPNEEDAFPDDGATSRDTDGDGVPDRYDPDMDGDGIPDHVDGDQDGDGTPDAVDAFPRDPREHADRDGDGVGDNADAFPDDPTGQRDTDGDGIPDSRDDDIDGDGVPNDEDPDPLDDTVRLDSDGDGVPDELDAFPSNPEESADTDGDGIGDNEDGDLDGDGVPNEEDAFPYDARESSDRDGDGIGDNADAFPDDATRSGDLDGDGIPDELDPDIDGDGVLNEFDAFPRDPSEDRDADGDGVGDNADAFPNDPSESRDTDGDGIGDNSDSDIDGDGLPNETDPDPYRFTSRVNLAWDELPETVVETTTFSLRAEPVIVARTQMGVAQSLGSPSGVVLLYFGDVVLRETLAADGSLTWVGTLPGGSYEIQAVYLGDVRFARSETEPESVRVEGPVSLFEEVEEDVQFLIEEGTREALTASMDANARVLTAARGRHHRGGAFNSLGTSFNPEVEYDGTFTASAEDGIVADGDIALEGASRLGTEGRAAVFVAGFASTTMNPGEVRTSLEASIAVETFLEDQGVTVGAFGTALSTSGSVQQNELVGVRGEYSLSVGGFLISPLVGALSLEAYAAGGVVGVNLDVANDVVRIQSVSQRLQAQLGVYVSGSLDVSIFTITPSFGLAIGGVQSGIAPIDAYAHGVSGKTETQVDGEEILRSSFQPTFTVNLSRIAWLQSMDPLDVTVTPTVQCDLSFGDATQCGWGLDAGFRVPLPYAVDGAVLASEARYEWKGERTTFGAKLYITYPY